MTGTSKATGFEVCDEEGPEWRDFAELAEGEAGERRESTTEATIRMPLKRRRETPFEKASAAENRPRYGPDNTPLFPS
jgi:hypothetical protein